MMSIQLKMWKQLIINQLRLSAKPHITFVNFCTQTAAPSTIPPHGAVVTESVLNKCGLTDEYITRAFKHRNSSFRVKSSQNMEEVLKLLNGCGLTTPTQIRRVALSNPRIFLLESESNVKSKLNFLRTFMKEEDISKLVMGFARLFDSREEKLKSAISLLQRLGVETNALPHLLLTYPRLLTTPEEKVIWAFKETENMGFKKGSKLFAAAIHVILGSGKEKLERKLQCLSSLGFTEKQVSELPRREPRILGSSEEKLKRNVVFLVNSMGLPFADIVKYPTLFTCSLEKRLIPRYRVIEALNSKHVQGLKTALPLGDMARMKEKPFLEKYVNKNAESSYLRDIYDGGKAGKLIIDKETHSGYVSMKDIHETSESLSGSST